MTKYRVIMTRDITESTTIDVEAESEEDAYAVAHAALCNDANPVWEIDDGSWNQDGPYVTGVEEVQ